MSRDFRLSNSVISTSLNFGFPRCVGSSALVALAVPERPSRDHQGEKSMADKTNFTKDEWALLLRSPMNAGMAISVAEPSGLWGLLKESFAGSAEMTHAATDPNANALVKAVVADFMSSEGRTVARDGLKAEFANSKPQEI